MRVFLSMLSGRNKILSMDTLGSRAPLPRSDSVAKLYPRIYTCEALLDSTGLQIDYPQDGV